jgi:peptidoglycan-N-acetylglucosamine deacetylase
LIHVTRLNAEALPAILDTFAARGYRFVTLREAMANAAYRLPDGAGGRYGPSWITRWARAMNRKIPPGGQPDPSDSTAQLARTVCQDL